MVQFIHTIISNPGATIVAIPRPEFSKIDFLLNLAEIISKCSDKNVVFFSLEHTKENLMSNNRIDIQKIHVIDKFDISEDDIRNIAYFKNGCSVIIIDYYQLLNPVLASKLSKIAKELSLHIIVSSLLPRDVEDLNAGKPTIDYLYSRFPGKPIIDNFDLVSFLWYPHKCERGIGVAHAYDIQLNGEFTIVKNNFGKTESYYITNN